MTKRRPVSSEELSSLPPSIDLRPLPVSIPTEVRSSRRRPAAGRQQSASEEQLLAQVIRLADSERPLSSARAIIMAVQDTAPGKPTRAFPIILTERAAELARMPYPDYLLTPEWQDRRKAMLEQASYRCQVCNGSKVLNVHHRTYERRGNELPADLVVLCQDCHHLFHENGKLARESA